MRAWSSAAWRASAVAWIDERLAEAGRERAGEVGQPRVRPWVTVLRVPVRGGAVWFKAAGSGTAYLDVFSDRGPRTELGETLTLACRVAKIARALTWHRALQAAREQGEEVDPAWAGAPLASLAGLLEVER